MPLLNKTPATGGNGMLNNENSAIAGPCLAANK